MEINKGKLNVEIAKEIIADHYDVYLRKENNPCSRTVCSHYELDAREYMSQSDRPKPFAPHGVVDGFVVDSSLAKKMAFVGRFGNSCGIPFEKDKFCDEHMQWNIFRPYLLDRPSQDWTEFSISMKTRKNQHSRRLLKRRNKSLKKEK
jgi:hypothetical protein